MKILYNHRTQGRGAESTHIMSIVDALEVQGHQVEILSPPGVNPRLSHGKAPVDKSKVEVRGVSRLWSIISKSLPDFLFEIIEIFYNIPLYFRMRVMLRKGRFDMVYERYAFFMIAGAFLAKKYNIPFVLEANEVSGIDNRARPQIFKGLCSWFERRLLSRSTSILPVSSKLKAMLVDNGGDENKIFVQPNAIDPRAVVVEQEKVEQLRSHFGLKDKVVIGCAGWFDKWDRLDFLLEAFVELIKSNPEIHLMIIGDGQVLQEMKSGSAYDQYMENITLTGAVSREDIYSYLSLLDVAILPHSNDFGSPVILFELMGLGRAIIAPSLPPIEDVVDDQDVLLTFEPLNQDDFISKIKLLVSSHERRETLGEASKLKVNERYTWLKNANNILSSIKR